MKKMFWWRIFFWWTKLVWKFWELKKFLKCKKKVKMTYIFYDIFCNEKQWWSKKFCVKKKLWWQNFVVKTNCDEKQKLWKKLKLCQLKNCNCDTTQNLKVWQNSKTEIVTLLKNSNCGKTQIVRKLKNSNCDKT